MANNKSAIKRNAQSEKRRVFNKHYRSRARTLVKNARTEIQSGDVPQSVEAVRLAVKDLDMAASRGVIHPRNAARRKSRLMKLLAVLQSQK